MTPAERDLSQFSRANVAFVVTIQLDSPAGTAAVGIEESALPDWANANISHGGGIDPETGEVKCGPFFDPSIPAAVTYEVTATDKPGHFCFTGTVCFGGPPFPIGGDACVGIGLPAVSDWGLAVPWLLVVCAATMLGH